MVVLVEPKGSVTILSKGLPVSATAILWCSIVLDLDLFWTCNPLPHFMARYLYWFGVEAVWRGLNSQLDPAEQVCEGLSPATSKACLRLTAVYPQPHMAALEGEIQIGQGKLFCCLSGPGSWGQGTITSINPKSHMHSIQMCQVDLQPVPLLADAKAT